MVTTQEKLKTIKKERNEARSRGFKYIFVITLISLIIPFIFSWNLIIAIISLLLFLVGLFFVIYKILAPANIIAYFVEEMYYFIIIEGGAYKRSDLQLTGHALTEKGWVVPANENDGIGILSKYNIDPGKRVRHMFLWVIPLPPIAGMRLFSLAGIFEGPQLDIFKWSQYDPESQEVIKREDVIFKGWFVVPYNYGIEIRNIYTKDGIPVGFNLGLLSVLLNAAIAAFEVKNWYQAFMKEVGNTVYRVINSATYDEIKDQSDPASYFFEKFEKVFPNQEMSLIERCLRSYGIHIMSIQIGKFIAPPDIANAADEQEKEELLKKGAEVKASADQAVVSTKVLTIDKVFLERAGIKYKKALKDPDFESKYGSLEAKCRDDVFEIMSQEKGRSVRVKSNGGIIDAAAVFQALSSPSSPASQVEGQKVKNMSAKEKKDRERLKDLHLSDEEIEKYY